MSKWILPIMAVALVAGAVIAITSYGRRNTNAKSNHNPA